MIAVVLSLLFEEQTEEREGWRAFIVVLQWAMGRLLDNPRHELTAERLKTVLCYEPETGHWYWLVTKRNIYPAGSRAGTTKLNGYVYVCIDRKLYLAHRLAWFYMTGGWPVDDIDHIDRNRQNNKWANLREATRAQNMANLTKHKDSISGYKGVSWHKRGKKWHAQIRSNGTKFHLGLFSSKEEAYAAYVTAATKLHGEFVNLG